MRSFYFLIVSILFTSINPLLVRAEVPTPKPPVCKAFFQGVDEVIIWVFGAGYLDSRLRWSVEIYQNYPIFETHYLERKLLDFTTDAFSPKSAQPPKIVNRHDKNLIRFPEDLNSNQVAFIFKVGLSPTNIVRKQFKYEADQSFIVSIYPLLYRKPERGSKDKCNSGFNENASGRLAPEAFVVTQNPERNGASLDTTLQRISESIVETFTEQYLNSQETEKQ